MAHALGIKSTLLPALVATFLCKVLPKSGPRLLKLPPIFAVLNGQFSRAIAKLSWAEMEVLFAKHDVWYELGCVCMRIRNPAVVSNICVGPEHRLTD